MFDYLRFRWKLGRLEREQRQSEKHYDAKTEAAKKRQASTEDIDVIEHEAAMENFYLSNEIQKLHSRYLNTQASRLLIPRPSLDDDTMWERDDEQYVHLTEHGINHLRAAIRAERKARVELFLMWVPGVVGILGALIGLAAILVGKR